MPSYDRALWALRTWLDSWAGMGHIAIGMHRQGYDPQLTQYDDRGWRTRDAHVRVEVKPTGGGMMANGNGRKRRLAREYLTCTPIREVAVQQVLLRATNIAPEARQRLVESRPELRQEVDQAVLGLLVEHFTIEELDHQVQWMTTRLGRSWLDKQPAFWAGISDAIQPLVQRAIRDIRGAEGGV